VLEHRAADRERVVPELQAAGAAAEIHDLVDALARRPDVARIDANAPFRGIEDPAISNITMTEVATAAVEPGVSDVRAPDVWNLGYTGAGVVIGDADTGVRWTHTYIKNAYRGWNG